MNHRNVATIEKERLPFNVVLDNFRNFDIDFVSRISKNESYRKDANRPVYYLHKYWARRTSSVFRSILLNLHTTKTYLPEEYYKDHHPIGNMTILDPFMGGGTIVGEAVRLGYKVIGIDINPISWLLVKNFLGDYDLSKVDLYFEKIEKDIEKKLSDLYKTKDKNGKLQTVAYYYWRMHIFCPQCRKKIYFSHSTVIATHATKNELLYYCSHCKDVAVTTYKDERYICNSCHSQNEIKVENSNGTLVCNCGYSSKAVKYFKDKKIKPNYDLIGLCFEDEKGNKHFKPAEKFDKDKYEYTTRLRINKEVIPDEPIKEGYNTNQILRYNFHKWTDLFNARQLYLLSTILGEILKIPDEKIKELFLLHFSGVLEFNNMLCSAKGLGTGAIRHIFSHHAFIPEKEPMEANVWGTNSSSGGFKPLFMRRLKRALEYKKNPSEIHCGTKKRIFFMNEHYDAEMKKRAIDIERPRDVFLACKSSTDLTEIPNESINFVVTDPPFYDNVMYSELAEFFYTWLKIGLSKKYSFFSGKSVDDKQEIIKNGVHKKDRNFYATSLQMVFSECHRVLKKNGLLIFTFHHSNPDAWSCIKEAVEGVNFKFIDAIPVFSEMDTSTSIHNKSAGVLDIIFICAKTATKPARRDYDALKESLKNSFNIKDADLKALEFASQFMR